MVKAMGHIHELGTSLKSPHEGSRSLGPVSVPPLLSFKGNCCIPADWDPFQFLERSGVS